MCRRNDVDASETVAYGFVTGLSLSLNDRVSMFGLVLDNRSRWHASIGGLLVAVMLACPFVCRAGACCSGALAESVSNAVDKGWSWVFTGSGSYMIPRPIEVTASDAVPLVRQERPLSSAVQTRLAQASVSAAMPRPVRTQRQASRWT